MRKKKRHPLILLGVLLVTALALIWLEVRQRQILEQRAQVPDEQSLLSLSVNMLGPVNCDYYQGVGYRCRTVLMLLSEGSTGTHNVEWSAETSGNTGNLSLIRVEPQEGIVQTGSPVPITLTIPLQCSDNNKDEREVMFNFFDISDSSNHTTAIFQCK